MIWTILSLLQIIPQMMNKKCDQITFIYMAQYYIQSLSQGASQSVQHHDIHHP